LLGDSMPPAVLSRSKDVEFRGKALRVPDFFSQFSVKMLPLIEVRFGEMRIGPERNCSSF